MNSTHLILVGIFAINSAGAVDIAGQRPSAGRMSHACAGCHGTFGHSQAPTPSIAEQPEGDFINAMREFKNGNRVSSVMNRIARGYTDEDFAAMAKFFRNR